MKIIGVDVGGTSIKMGVFSTEGVLESKWEIPTRVQNEGKEIIADIAATIYDYLDKYQISLEEIAGVGVGIPGPVIGDGEVEVCVNLGWKHKKLKQELSAMLKGIPVAVGNDANVAALGEVWKGGGRGFHDAIVIPLGTGIGGGIIIDGKIHTGCHGWGGEIGHMRVGERAEEDFCNCGSRGCLEQYASATGIVRLARKMLPEPMVFQTLTAKNVFDMAKLGNAEAMHVIETAGYYLGIAMVNLSLSVDPEVFVIGGGVSKAGKFFLDIIEKHYSEGLTLSKQRAKIHLAELGNDAGIFGAAKMVRDMVSV